MGLQRPKEEEAERKAGEKEEEEAKALRGGARQNCSDSKEKHTREI